MAKALAFVIGAILVLTTGMRLDAATYYLDCDLGRDSNSGTAPAAAWQTVARANQAIYGPGDQILFKRGCRWAGPGFRAQGNGSASMPIVLGDYGDVALARALIDGIGPHEPAVLLQNVQHWVVRNLELTQHGQTPQALDSNNEKGKDADQYSDEYMRAVVHILGLGAANEPNCGEACTVRDIVLENLVVRDGSWNGIYASGGYYQLRTGQYGVVDQLRIREVESFRHHKAGIEVTCTYFQTRIYASSNIWILDSYLHDNGGDGAMVGPVRNALLDGNLCAYNGRLRNARVGCWTWDSENTTLQFNESHHNMTPLTNNKARDGAGFDLDLGTENGMLQYNWSHDNEGEGFLLLAWPVGFGFERGDSHNAQMRYNLGERDGKKLAGAITIFGGVSPAVIHNNTIYYEPDRLAGTDMFNGEGGAVTTSIFGKSGRPDVKLYNNIFITNGRRNPAAASNNFWTDGAGTFSCDHNLWWRVEGGVRFQWAGSALTSWSAWLAHGFDAHGVNADPLLAGPFGGGPASYLPTAVSPALDRGRTVTEGLRGMGSQDALGASTPQGASYEIGAVERRATSDPAAPRITSASQQADGRWRVQFVGVPGRSYSVDASSNLRDWSSAGRATERAAGMFEFIERSNSPRFYRAAAQGIRSLFDEERFGRSPAQFEFIAAGTEPILPDERPFWRTFVDPSAPSPPTVLIQTSAVTDENHYPIAFLRDVTASNGVLSVQTRAFGPTASRGAGLLWGARDKEHWMAALLNPYAGTLQLLAQDGKVSQLACARVVCEPTGWNRLSVGVDGERVRIWLNEQPGLQAALPHSPRGRRIGLITHAETVAVFDNFSLD